MRQPIAEDEEPIPKPVLISILYWKQSYMHAIFASSGSLHVDSVKHTKRQASPMKREIREKIGAVYCTVQLN